MPRRKLIAKRELLPDPRFNSVLVQQFINYLMERGKKSSAEGVFYGAMDVIQQRTGQDPMAVFKQALNNVKPAIEVAYAQGLTRIKPNRLITADDLVS